MTARLPNLLLAALACLVVPALGLVAPALVAQPADDTAARLARGFDSPPPEARPHVYWLWLNGYIDLPTAREELRAMKEAGFSGVLAFDMGARGPKGLQPPAGPAFLDPAWLRNFREVVSTARGLGLQFDFSVISSWDLGGQWVEPRHASMGLYSTEIAVTGGRAIDTELPFPLASPAAPKGPDGKPAFWKDVATVAVRTARLRGHEFVLRLDPDRVNDLREAVFDNGTPGAGPALAATMTPTREIALAVSTTGTREGDFREVLRASLPAAAGAARFPLPAGTGARYVRLTLLSGHDASRPRWTLGDFALLDPQGLNVAGSRHIDRARPGALMIRHATPLGYDADWNVDNLHDANANGPGGVFATAGPPPLRLPSTDAVVDLTTRVDASGRLRWDAPAGEWTVQRYVCMNTGERLKVPSPNSDGWATDHLNADATRAYMEHVVARLREGLGHDLRASGLKNLYLASYEVRGPVWSPTFTQEFRKRRGYDMTPYLPVVFGSRLDNEELTDRFLFDYHKTLGEVLVDAYYRAARDVAAAAGLTIKSEAGGPGPPIHNVPVDALLANNAVDEIQGEFWPKRWNADGLWVVKETAAAGHIYGKRTVHMEAFTSDESWGEGPQDLKPSADRVFTEGGNHMVWHTWSHAPPEAGTPGWAYYAGTHVNRKVPWWPRVRPWIDYLSRASYLLQQGTFVADVLYYYGDGGYRFVGPRRNEPSLGPGYDYDVVNSDVLLSSAAVRDGRVAIPGGSDYALLVLPDRDDIPPAVLAKVDQLVSAGAIVVGPKPRRAAGLERYPASDNDVRALADRLWGAGDASPRGERTHGKGKVIWGTPLREILHARGIAPDFEQAEAPATSASAAGAPAGGAPASGVSATGVSATGVSATGVSATGGPFDFIHRRDGSPAAAADVYFVRNTLDREASAKVTFRVAGRQPELWDAVTGTRRPVSHFTSTNGRTTMTMTLAKQGSTFVVFAKPAGGETTGADVTASASSSGGAPVLRIDRGWTLELQPAAGGAASGQPAPNGGPAAPRRLDVARLGAWTEHDDPAVRYFTGTGRYVARFELPRAWDLTRHRAHLDLGALWSIASVRLNDRDLGVVWTAPFQVDATAALRPGENELVVEVTNNWHNRLAGDAALPPARRVTRTNVITSGGIPWRDLKPIPSGLFGPVTLTLTRDSK